MQATRTERRAGALLKNNRLCTALAMCALLSACAGQPRAPAIDPDEARDRIVRLLPRGVGNPERWAVDMFAAFEALRLEPSAENICAVVAVTQQESGFQANPTVAGLPGIARREIEARAKRSHIPKLLVDGALRLRSPNGKTYEERIAGARTEQELSEIFEDFIGMVPLGRTLFADWNPVRTAGPMQVSIAFAEEHAKRKDYPYPIAENIRHEVFTRRGGLYFGIAHLLDYEADYDQMLFRFADFNAGHFASRNAGFQNAVNVASGSKLALDGDLLRYDGKPSNTEVAVRKLLSDTDMSKSSIHDDLERGRESGFERTDTYQRVFERGDRKRGQRLPRSVVPHIRLQSPKITRNLTTEWFARRVDDRYRQCLGRR